MQRPRTRERHWAERCERGVACLVEGGEPAVEEVAGGGVGDEADLVAETGQANEDGGVNRADVVSRAGGYRSVGGIAEDDGVDLVRIALYRRELGRLRGGLAEREVPELPDVKWACPV